jgi:hypothetical protein
MLFEGRANPVAMVAEIERLYYRTRRSYRVALVATFVTVAAAVYQVLHAIGAALP